MNENKLAEEIRKLAKEKNAVILAHNYQIGPVQDVADLTGDSLELSIKASKTEADIIVFCGVHFMAESASILSPDKQVLLPHMGAGCPMADMINADELRQFKKENPGAAVVSYVNTSAEVKAESDVCCTSANAVQVVESLDARKVLFTPDRNLASWVRKHSNKEIIAWDGYCIVHDQLTVDNVLQAKEKYPEAKVIIHPECPADVVDLADAVRSTSGMIAYVQKTDAKTVIVCTEEGLIHRMQKDRPDITFVEPTIRMVCANMKKITLEHVLGALQDPQQYEVKVPEEIRLKARQSLDRMVAIPSK